MHIALISISALRNAKEATRITLLSLAQELQKQGHTATIICEKVKELPEFENINGVALYRYHFPLLSKLFSPARAVRALQRKNNVKFDIIHGFSSTPLFAVSTTLAKKICSSHAKVISTLRSYSREKLGNGGYFLLNLADNITVPSKVFTQKISTASQKKMHIVPSWLDLSKFQPMSKDKLKKKYGYENKKVVLHYGAMWKNKGTNYLIQALPEIIKKEKNVLFIFAPRYQEITELKAQVEQMKATEHVHFITKDIPIADYVNFADVVALPYVNLLGTEGNPSCLLEAMACKTPVVTSALPEIEEITAGSVFLANPGDVTSLAEKIVQALQNPSAEMVEQAYQKVQKFSVENAAKKFLEIYKSNSSSCT